MMKRCKKPSIAWVGWLVVFCTIGNFSHLSLLAKSRSISQRSSVSVPSKKKAGAVHVRRKVGKIKEAGSEVPACPLLALPRLYEQFAPYCVRIRYQEKGEPKIVSGFFVSEQGHVLTSVVGGSNFVVETHSHQPFSAKKCGEDAVSSLCLLQIQLEKNQTVPYFSLCRITEWPSIGEPLVSLSCKLGQSISPQVGFATHYSERYFQKEFPFTFVRSTLHIDAGDCGGAVIDLQGNLRGMLLHALSDTKETFYMPTGGLDRVFQDLLLYGRVHYSYAGLSTETVFDHQRQALCLKIREVIPGSPAEKSGFSKEDILIEKNGEPIGSIEAFKNFIFLSKPNDCIVFTLLRSGKTIRLPLCLSEKK